MKVKPKSVMLNLPIVLMFNDSGDIPMFAEQINTIINGKIKLKYDVLGELNNQWVVIYYLNRHDEYTELKQSFREMIELEEIEANNRPVGPKEIVSLSAMLCNHYNEVPLHCTCTKDCFCKSVYSRCGRSV
jgi:hypothetical protein